MIVDDDEAFRRVLCQTLLRAGYTVTTAENGDAALRLRLYREDPVEIVITDLIMPEKEGFETITALRVLQPDVKIIAISGGGHIDVGDYLPAARHLGAAKVLAKPFTSQEILEALESLVDCPPAGTPVDLKNKT